MAEENMTPTMAPRSRVAGADRSRRAREQPSAPGSGAKSGGKRGARPRAAVEEPAAGVSAVPVDGTASAPARRRSTRGRDPAASPVPPEATVDSPSAPTDEGGMAAVAAASAVHIDADRSPSVVTIGHSVAHEEVVAIGAEIIGAPDAAGSVDDVVDAGGTEASARDAVAPDEVVLDVAPEEVLDVAFAPDAEVAEPSQAPEETTVLAGDVPASAPESGAAVLVQPEPQNVMEVGLKPQDVKAGLAAVVAALPAKASLPVLHSIMIETDGPSHVRLTATDLDTTVTRRIAAVVSEPGAVLVAGKKFHEIVREIPDGCVLTLRLKEDTLHVSCQATRTRYKLPTMPRDEFPNPPGIQWEGNAFGIAGATLGLMIERTSFATSTEETRPILNGVLWEFSEDDMGMVATNGHRLSGTHVPLDTGAGRPAMIIHPRALGMVARLPAEGELVQVARTENHVGFRGDGWEIITRLMVGPYPPYRQVLPKDNDKVLVADKAALTAALRRMAIVASDQTHRVTFALGDEPTLMRISVETSDIGTAEEHVAVEYEGDPLEIGFNAQYLLEVLRYCPAGEVRMTFKAPERAAIIAPVDDDSGARTAMLVMPLRLR